MSIVIYRTRLNAGFVGRNSQQGIMGRDQLFTTIMGWFVINVLRLYLL